MSKEKILFVIGVLTIAVPNLGFPNLIEKIIFVFLGALVIIVAYGLRFDRNKTKKIMKKEKIPVARATEIQNDDVEIIKNSSKEEITGFSYVKKDVKEDV